MSSSSPIGGFLELEGQADLAARYPGAVFVNSGRNALEYIVRAGGFTHLYLSKFNCDAVLEPLERLGIGHSFYSLDDRLEIAGDISVSAGQAVLYVDYFGIKDEYARALAATYGDALIVDASQAFYCQPTDSGRAFCSPRKFFGLPDGGLLYAPDRLDEELSADVSYDRCLHLLKRTDIGPEAAYEDYKANEASLAGRPLKRMSRLTAKMLASVDAVSAGRQRLENYAVLHAALGAGNQLDAALDEGCVPLCYPYRTSDKMVRQKLIGSKIFVPTYWPNVAQWCGPDDLEYKLAEEIIPLPVDQRYGAEDMQRMVDVIHG